jgi:hypothetical protein
MKLFKSTNNSEKLEKMIEKLEEHPIIQQILADESAQNIARRREAAGKIEDLEKAQAEALPKLHANVDEKEADFFRAKAAFENASSEFNLARHELTAATHNYERQINAFKNVLFESCDPVIDETIQFFREKLDWLRRPGRISCDARGSERNLFNETMTLTSESNKNAVLQAMSYCREAIAALELLKFEPECDSARIEEMKAGIPPIDVFAESSVKKALPGSKIPTAMQLLKSDDQINWEIGKINEKVRKILKR